MHCQVVAAQHRCQVHDEVGAGLSRDVRNRLGVPQVDDDVIRVVYVGTGSTERDHPDSGRAKILDEQPTEPTGAPVTRTARLARAAVTGSPAGGGA